MKIVFFGTKRKQMFLFAVQVRSRPLLSWWLVLKSEHGREVKMFLRAKTQAPKPQMILLQRIRVEEGNQNPNLVIYLPYFRHHEILVSDSNLFFFSS